MAPRTEFSSGAIQTGQQPSRSELNPQLRHGFQMAFVVSGEAQHKMRCASPRISLQPFCQTAVWTGIARLPAPHHGSWLAIILFEISVEPFVGTAAVLIGDYRHIHGAGQRIWITPRRVSDFLDLVP